MFLDLWPSDLLWNTCKQTPLNKTLNLYPLCAPTMFLLLPYVSQTVVLWLKSVKVQSSDNVTNDWIFFCLTQTFKGLWKDVIILVFLFFFWSSLCSSGLQAQIDGKWRAKRGGIWEGFFVKIKNELAFGKNELKWIAWEILSGGYLVCSCMYFHFYTGGMHVRNSRRLMFTWVLVSSCRAVRMYLMRQH